MLFEPTTLEKLSQLVDNLLEKQNNLHSQLEYNEGEKNRFSNTLQEKDEYISSLEQEIESKNSQINTLKDELQQKDSEIEAIVAKIESMLG